jgi:phosphatidylserine/phosphatidylglycerophosphate/cardiolipin synthase-like enzyme
VDTGLIHQARSSITVAMYTFTDRNLAYALVEAARRGIQIGSVAIRG